MDSYQRDTNRAVEALSLLSLVSALVSGVLSSQAKTQEATFFLMVIAASSVAVFIVIFSRARYAELETPVFGGETET